MQTLANNLKKDENIRLVNLRKDKMPNLYDYIVNKRKDLVIDKLADTYIHVEEKALIELSFSEDKLKVEMDEVLDSEICPHCNTRTTGGFYLTYRGQMCVSKSLECPICYNMDYKTFYKVKEYDDEKKFEFVKEFVKELF